MATNWGAYTGGSMDDFGRQWAADNNAGGYDYQGGAKPAPNLGMAPAPTPAPTPAPVAAAPTKLDFNNVDHQNIAKSFYDSLNNMVGSGNEAEARSTYLKAQNQYGFTDAQFSPFAYKSDGKDGSKGYFSGEQLASWKTGAPTPVAPTPAAPAPNLGMAPQTPAQQVAPTTTLANPTFEANGGSANPAMAEYTKNPYLDQMAQGITSQVNDNWTRNLAPSIRSGAMAAGGFGGSRQGVVEANALKDVNQGLSNSLSNLYNGDYQQSQNRNLQKYQSDQGYNLGMSNNNLGYANNALGYSNLDSNNQQFGANFGLQSQNYQNQWANNNANTANNIAQTPLNYFNAFNANANAIAGQGGSTSQTNQANPWMSFAGGAQLANNYFNPKP